MKKNKIIISFLFSVLIGIGVHTIYSFIYSAPAKASNIVPVFKGDANEFKYILTQDLKYWNDKVVQIQGKITYVDEYGILLNKNIFCQFDQNIDIPSNFLNNHIVIKGRVVGFDELLMEIKLNQCIIIQ